MTLKALIWDVDGTVAETERDGHRFAFNAAFEALGLPWHWDVAHYGRLLRVAGGRERLLHDMAERPEAPADAAGRNTLARELHRRKNAVYRDLVNARGIPARPGVLRLMDECSAAGVMLAVATTTSRGNVAVLLESLLGIGWGRRFDALVCAEEAPLKKPHPQVYQLALQRLGLAPHEAFALEDSPGGLAAARAAGIACGITRSVYFADGDFSGAAWVREDLDEEPAMTLHTLQAERAGTIAAS